MISLIDHFEPAALCLLASLIWAPFVLVGALRLDRGRSLAASELLWLSALLLAVLPTLIAPALAAAGVSLRPPKVVEISASAVSEAAPPASARPVQAPAAEPAAQSPPQALSAQMALNAAGLVYLYGALLAFGAYLVRGALFARQVRAAEPIDHPELLSALDAFGRRFGLTRNFELRRSDAVTTVCVFGFFRPVILLPRDIDARLSFEDLVLMGAHELAHVKRGDAVLFTLAALLRILFWFNPFVRQIAARAELAAEQGADALVLSLGADRRRYAACFIEGLKFAADRAQVARFAVPSFTPFDRQSRRDRLNAILTGEMRRGRPFKVLVALALVLAAGAAFAQAGLAVAPETKVVPRAPVRIDTREGKPMRAPFDGVVITATDVYRGQPSLGKVVVIRHDDGRSTMFSRLASYSVKKGDRVRRGDQIGVAGEGQIVSIDTAGESSIAPPVPLASLAPVAPVSAAPLPAPAPAPNAAPPAAPPPSGDVDVESELDGGETPAAPDPGESHVFAPSPASAYVFETGDDGARIALLKQDGAIVGFDGRELSAEEKQRFEEKLRELKKNLEGARKLGDSWAWVGGIDSAAIRKMREEAAIDARELAARLKEQGLSARELARIQREAVRSAERAFARSRDALKEGWTGFSFATGCDAACQEEARAEAQAAREEARAEAEAAREEARVEAEAARQEAEEERRQIEEEIRDRAAALADAERDLAEERAELERLKAELAAAKKSDEQVW